MSAIYLETPAAAPSSELTAGSPLRPAECSSEDGFDEHLRRARGEEETHSLAEGQASAPLEQNTATSLTPTEQTKTPGSGHEEKNDERATDEEAPQNGPILVLVAEASPQVGETPGGPPAAASVGKLAEKRAAASKRSPRLATSVSAGKPESSDSTLSAGSGGAGSALQAVPASLSVDRQELPVPSPDNSTTHGQQPTKDLQGAPEQLTDLASSSLIVQEGVAQSVGNVAPGGMPVTPASGGGDSSRAEMPPALPTGVQGQTTNPLAASGTPLATPLRTQRASNRAGHPGEENLTAGHPSEGLSKPDVQEISAAEPLAQTTGRLLVPEWRLTTEGPKGDPAGETLSAHPAHGSESLHGRREPSDVPSRPLQAPDPQAGTAMETADRVRFVQRVARAMETADMRGTPLRIRLHPPELGTLRLEVMVRNGAMSARLEAETEAARTLLLDHLPMLRERLAEHNLRIDRFDVQWSGGSSGGLSERPGQGAPGQPHAHPAVPEPRRPAGEPAPASPPQLPRRTAASHIDIMI